MPDSMIDLLDLELAWRRVKLDLPDRVFVRHPYELELIETNLETWLESLRRKLTDNTYNPEKMLVCDVPKGAGLVRPGGHLTIADRVVYAACVGASLERIYDYLSSQDDKIDFSYRLNKKSSAEQNWLRDRFSGWRDFRLRSLERIDAGAEYVLIADISGCYENIDLNTLISDLRGWQVPTAVIDLLSKCLNRWAQVPGRGLPQGHSPSDILAKLYLSRIDMALKDRGYVHCRYVDDYRVFCENELAAKKALVEFTGLLRRRGLSVQTHKTAIHSAADARYKIDGVVPTLLKVQRQFIDMVNELLAEDDPYLTLSEAEQALAGPGWADPAEAPIELLREAYRKHFIEPNDAFNRTLFRFLLRRLGAQADDFAIGHCLSLLEEHPEETKNILRYANQAGCAQQAQERITAFLNSESAIYPYQVYEMIEWVGNLSEPPKSDLIAVVRRTGFDPRQPAYVRAVCRKVLAEHGTQADLDRLESQYAESYSALEQSEIICAIRQMERVRRNAFIARAEGDGDMQRRAARLIKQRDH